MFGVYLFIVTAIILWFRSWDVASSGNWHHKGSIALRHLVVYEERV